MDITFTNEQEATDFYTILQDTIKFRKKEHLLKIMVESSNVRISIKRNRFYVLQSILPHVCTEFILRYKETKWLNEKLHYDYLFDDPLEREQVLQLCLQVLNGKRQLFNVHREGLQRRNGLFEVFQRFFMKEMNFIFEGFIQFRLREYQVLLEKHTQWAIDEYMMEQDYQQVMQDVREYVRNRTAYISEMTLVAHHDFLLYDSYGQSLPLEQLVDDVSDETWSKLRGIITSSIVSILIEYAPRKLHIYSESRDHSLLITLQNIFQERIHWYPMEQFKIVPKMES